MEVGGGEERMLSDPGDKLGRLTNHGVALNDESAARLMAFGGTELG